MKKLILLFALLVVSTAHALELDYKVVVPSDAAVSACVSEPPTFWLFKFLHIGGKKRCSGAVVEAETISTIGARTVYSLTRIGDLNSAMGDDRKSLDLISRHELMKNYYAENNYYFAQLTHPSLRFLYGENSGASDGRDAKGEVFYPTIGQHTARVLNIYLAQRGFYKLDQLEKPSAIRNLGNVLYFTLAFHDIGKSIPAKINKKEREVEFSMPIASSLMPAMGFNPSETMLGLKLIQEHQLYGAYLRNRIGLGPAINELKVAASEAGLPAKTFFKLLELFYVADAGSYKSLSGLFSVDETGKWNLVAAEELNQIYKAL